MIDINKYFERIGYTGQRTVSVETLKAIHEAQVFSIPFENIAIHELQNANTVKNFILLDDKSLFKKLVTDKRGGYCHENNELLALILIQLGFKVDRLAARVLTAPNLPRGHKLLLVTIDDQQWIADVGFGSYGLFKPMLLETDKQVQQHCDTFQFVKRDGKYIYQLVNGDGCKDLYEFTLEVFLRVDFNQMSYNVSHDPESIFVTNRLCVMPRKQGRIVLNNNKLRITENGQDTIVPIKDDQECLAILSKYFGIHLPEGTQLKEIQVAENNPKEKEEKATKEEKEDNAEEGNITKEQKETKTTIWCTQFTQASMVAVTNDTIYEELKNANAL